MPTLLNTLGIEVPIIQAPMAGISTPTLAAAVSNARALGSLGVGAMTPDNARSAIQQTRALTPRAINVNVFCHNTALPNPTGDQAWLNRLRPWFQQFDATPPAALREIYTSFNQNPAMLAMLLEERPAVVSFHFGLPPQESLDALRQAGIVLIASATNLAEAKAIEHAGLHAIIAQGVEAGGHRGMFDPDAMDEGLGTLALTRLLVKHTSLPIIATGGIMDGAGINAALALGAQVAQLGTAFVTCPESAADDAYRAALLHADDQRATTLTKAISGRAARGLQNRLTELDAESMPIPGYPLAYDAAKALHTAAKAHGSAEFAAHWAGQGFRLSRAMPAAQLIQQLQAERTTPAR